MAVLTNPIGILYAEIDSADSLKLTGDRVLYGAKKSSLAQTEWLTRQKVARCRESIARIVHSHGGIVCAIAGDQVFCNLPNPDATLQAACEIQQGQGRNASTETHDVSDIVTTPLGIRVATHYAPLVVNSGRIQGPAREAAHSILKRAETDQIVASQALVDALAPQARGRIRELGIWSLGGDDGDIQVYDVDWSEADERDAVPTPSV
ncbi:MAG: class 3 adenylate cyclase, partial [Gammaproteobacteria bacterium]